MTQPNGSNGTSNGWLAGFLLKVAFTVIGVGGTAYASYLYHNNADHETRISNLERTIVSINTKLDLALEDIRFHHGEVRGVR